ATRHAAWHRDRDVGASVPTRPGAMAVRKSCRPRLEQAVDRGHGACQYFIGALTGVDQTKPFRFGGGAGSVGLAHAVEKRIGLTLDSITRRAAVDTLAAQRCRD